MVTEYRRNAREDRLRFVQDKLSVYAALLNECDRDRRLVEKLMQHEGRHKELQTQVDGLFAQHGETTRASDVPGGAELVEQTAELEATGAALKAQVDERVREIGRVVSMLVLLAPSPVTAAARHLMDALTDELPEPEYGEALATFLAAARRDLGEPML